MAFNKAPGGKFKKRPRRVREVPKCRFCPACKEHGFYIDYKDTELLEKLITSRGKIFSRKRSGNCASSQRKAQKAIKQARFMAMLPFSS